MSPWTLYNELSALARLGPRLATKQDLAELGNRIMSAISDYAARVDTVFTSIGESVDSVQASLAGLTTDVDGLKKIIADLQNNPGPITPADQALLDAGEAKVGGLADKLKLVAAALSALDAATENPPTPAP